MQRRAALVLLFALIASIVGSVSFPSVASAASTVGSFEIDGNLADPTPGEPLDWSSIPNPSNFSDGTGKNDDIFSNGSKELEPGGWACLTGSAPGKDDLLTGQVAFRTLGTGTEAKQFVYVDYTRKAVNGDAHIDYEFNQSTEPNKACPALPVRTDGDIVITFDTENGGADIFVRAFRWAFTSPGVGTFTELPVGSRGVTFDGAVNIPNTIQGLQAGAFGEAALNLTDTIGSVRCGQFASVYMKTRASTSITAALKDRTAKQPVKLAECPNSSLAKAVRNLGPTGSNQSATFSTTTTARPGDTLEYRLTYTNAGLAPATNVVITDTVQGKQTYVGGSCSNACDATELPKLKWTFPSIGAGATQVVTFKVTVNADFLPGSTPVKNIGAVDTNEEPEKPSNDTTVHVEVPSPLTSDKSVVPTSAAVGATVAYSVKVTNPGTVATTTTITDDYDEDVLQISNISSSGGVAGVNNGDTVVWTNVPVPANSTITLTYSAKILALPDSTPGGDGCGSTELPVVNLVTITGGTGDRNVLCVPGQPALAVSKVRVPCPEAVVSGGQVTYAITYSNTGIGDATNAVLTDTITSGGLVLDGGGGTVAADRKVVTWNLGTIAPNTSGTKTITVQVTAPNGATVNDTATLTSNGGTASAPPSVVSTPVTSAGASTHGDAFGLDARLLGSPLLPQLGLSAAVATQQPGAPADAGKTLIPIGLPGVVTAGVITTSSQSDLTNEATSTAVGQLANLNILNGLVTADLVKGVSQSTAGPFNASFNSTGSTFVNLAINGTPITNVAPNGAAIVIPAALGLAEIHLYESTGTASGSGATVNTANGSVNMIRVKLLGGLNNGVEIIVGHAGSDATYPSGEPCGATAATVSGRAFTALVKTVLQTAVVVGDALLSPTGGAASSGTKVNVSGVATSRTADNDTSGSLTPTPNATSSSVVENVKLLGGVIEATLLNVSCASTTAGGSASTSLGFTFAGLKVGPTTFNPLIPIAPNTTIAIPQADGSLLLVVLNEQVSSGDGVNNTQGTVNAIHVRVLRGTALETEVIIASAHCDAHRSVPAP